ncbi:MAG: glycoside hydrolase family 97 N-terminal domain-containing protein [Verrucomicrobia bacterium]|nr:glycoside hydrolase family 97 N-terminal domain-containing protein [Verrucomicrobiota bacterium]
MGGMQRRMFLILVLASALPARALESRELASPGGVVRVRFSLRAFGVEKGCPAWSVSYKGRPALLDSRLGLELEDGPLFSGMRILEARARTHAGRWRPVCGERAEVPDIYRELTVDLQEETGLGRKARLTFRAYDEGAAVRYTLLKQLGKEKARILAERTEFRFPEDWPAWATYSAQGLYQKVPISRIKPGCERPLLIQAAGDLHLALAEAQLVDYARMKFAPLSGTPHALRSRLDGPVEGALPLRTPWRVVMAAESPGKLLENNFLLLNLNDPCALKDTSWIRPGKVIREVTLTTQGGMACVDFAARHGLQFVEYDAGWYGPENDPQADAATVSLDPKRSKGPLDLQAVIRYARSRGIGVILYVNRRALERQLDRILPLYRSWGVQGIKFGFVRVGSQRWTRWLHHAIRRCADYRLMADIHDEYRPTGFRRTYPNLMTMEGVRGDEARPTNDQTLVTVFARLLAGPADNTICWMSPRVRQNASYAYQLAKAVCIFSPWQFLFWYDRPAAVPETPELDFFKALPTTWDETQVLEGAPGLRAAVARRKGQTWFLGCMNGLEPWALDLTLDFLAPGRAYAATICTDDPHAPAPTGVRVERIRVRHGDRLKRWIQAKHGLAARFEPERP